MFSQKPVLQYGYGLHEWNVRPEERHKIAKVRTSYKSSTLSDILTNSTAYLRNSDPVYIPSWYRKDLYSHILSEIISLRNISEDLSRHKDIRGDNDHYILYCINIFLQAYSFCLELDPRESLRQQS